MEAYQIEQNIKSFTLTVDEPHLSSTRQGVEVNYKSGDQVIVSLTKAPTPGSLVLVEMDNLVRLCRYEKIYNNEYLFPPLSIDPSRYQDVIKGQVIDHVRIKKWLSIKG